MATKKAFPWAYTPDREFASIDEVKQHVDAMLDKGHWHAAKIFLDSAKAAGYVSATLYANYVKTEPELAMILKGEKSVENKS